MEDDVAGMLLQALERKDEEIDHLHKPSKIARKEIHTLDEVVSLKDEMLITKTEGKPRLLTITKELAAKQGTWLLMPVQPQVMELPRMGAPDTEEGVGD